jgi:hypothetical protein
MHELPSGASWITPSLEPLKNVPYPYSEGRMPSCPNVFTDYPAIANNDILKVLVSRAVEIRGGFGLFKKDSGETFDSDLNLPLLTALGLKIPQR